MGVLTVKKYFINPGLVSSPSLLSTFAPTATTAGYVAVTWYQEILNNNPGSTAMVLKSVSTQFTGNKHGYYDAELQIELLGDNFSSSKSDVSSLNDHALGRFDLGWDPTSDSSFQTRPMHLRIGEVVSLRQTIKCSLTAKFTAYNGPIVYQSPAYLNSGNIVTNSWFNPTVSVPNPVVNPVIPMYIELVFEYGTQNRN